MITVKGVEVRAEEVNIETEFRYLTEEGQKRLFLENKEAFLLDALHSDYSAVCRLLWEPEVLKSCSPALLNEAIIPCLSDASKELEDVKILINTLGSELDEGCIEFIVYAPFALAELEIKVLVAQNEKTSLKLLKEMFFLAALKFVSDNEPILFDAIVTNPNFEVDEEIEQTIRTFVSKRAEKIKKRIEQLRK